MNIIQHIKDSGLTVVGVCKEAGISRGTLYRIAKGQEALHGTVVRLAAAMGVPAALIMAGKRQQ